MGSLPWLVTATDQAMSREDMSFFLLKRKKAVAANHGRSGKGTTVCQLRGANYGHISPSWGSWTERRILEHTGCGNWFSVPDSCVQFVHWSKPWDHDQTQCHEEGHAAWLTKTSAASLAVGNLARETKWAILENLSTTVNIIVMPWDTGKPVKKFSEMLDQGHWGIGRVRSSLAGHAQELSDWTLAISGKVSDSFSCLTG